MECVSSYPTACRQCNVSLWVGSPLSISGMKHFGDWLTHYYYWFIHILIYMSMYMDVYGHTGHRSQSSIEHFMLYEQGPLIVNNDRTLCTGVTEVFPLQPYSGMIMPTLRAALRKAQLIQEEFILREEFDRRNIEVGVWWLSGRELITHLFPQW